MIPSSSPPRNDESVDAVHRRLIERRNRIGQDFKQTIFAESYLGMIGVEAFRDRTRERRFGECRFVKDYAEGFRS